jgi:hypothetical protein
MSPGRAREAWVMKAAVIDSLERSPRFGRPTGAEFALPNRY